MRRDVGLLGGAVAFAAVRLAMFLPARHGIGADRYGDTAEYERIARLPLTSIRFFTEHKPFGYPLVLRLVGEQQAVVVWLQLGVSVVCWTFLAVVLAQHVSRRVSLLAAGSVFALGCAWPIAQWDSLELTESLTVSAFVALVAFGLRFASRPTGGRAAAVVGVAFAFSSLRDTNALVALAVLLALAVIAYRPARRPALTLALAGVACVVLVVATTSVRRWELLVADQIGKRALASPAALSYFRAHGMPVRPGLAARIFADTRSPFPATTFEGDPRLAWFMPWFKSRARTTYNGYLLSHPESSLVTPVRRFPLMLDPAGLETYRAPGFRPLPAALEHVVYPSGDVTLLLLVAVLGTTALVILRGRAVAVLPAALLLLTLPLAIVVWDGEPSEVPRHALLVGVTARVALVVAGWLCLSALAPLPRRRRRPARQARRVAGTATRLI